MRFLVQSLDTGRFLVPSLTDGQPEWVRSLRDAGGGVITDEDEARSMGIEYAEMGEAVQLIDLDRLGTVKRRPVLDELLRRVGPGDVLVVYKMDRLARSLSHLLEVLALLEARGASFRSLTETIDTHSAAGRLFLQMLGSFAEFERSLIRERCMAGQAAARARGQTWGRPRAMPTGLESEVVSLYATGFFTMQVLAEVFEVSKEAVKRAIYRVTKPDSPCLR